MVLCLYDAKFYHFSLRLHDYVPDRGSNSDRYEFRSVPIRIRLSNYMTESPVQKLDSDRHDYSAKPTAKARLESNKRKKQLVEHSTWKLSLNARNFPLEKQLHSIFLLSRSQFALRGQFEHSRACDSWAFLCSVIVLQGAACTTCQSVCQSTVKPFVDLVKFVRI